MDQLTNKENSVDQDNQIGDIVPVKVFDQITSSIDREGTNDNEVNLLACHQELQNSSFNDSNEQTTTSQVYMTCQQYQGSPFKNSFHFRP